MASIIGTVAAQHSLDGAALEIEQRRQDQYDAGYRMARRDWDGLHTGSAEFVSTHPVPRIVHAESKLRERMDRG